MRPRGIPPQGAARLFRITPANSLGLFDEEKSRFRIERYYTVHPHIGQGRWMLHGHYDDYKEAVEKMKQFNLRAGLSK